MAIELTDSSINKIVDGLITKGGNFSQTEHEAQLRNIKELLKNYRLLENHVDVDLPKLLDDVPLSKYELSLYSLLGYRARSKEMIIFFNQVIDRYHKICEAGTYEEHRRNVVVHDLYLVEKPLTRIQIAEKFNVDESTIRRDERIAIKELTIMVFGIDGFNDVNKMTRMA